LTGSLQDRSDRSESPKDASIKRVRAVVLEVGLASGPRGFFYSSEGSRMADWSQLLAGGEIAEGEASLGPKPARAAFWLGVAGMVTWLVPVLGVPVSCGGLVLAVRGRREGAKRAGIATVLSAIGLALSLTMWIGSAVVIGRYTA
jgi:hypothetical protein